MQKIGIAVALALAAGAMAQNKNDSRSLLTGVNTGVGGGGSRVINTLNFNVAGIDSWDSFGDPDNELFANAIGANSHVIGIGWDVTLQANGASWLSELQVSFEDSAQSTGVFLSPGVADSFPGGPTTYSSGGIVDLVGLALDFNVGGDGNLRMEFFEGFDDVANAIDGNWISGALTIQYEVIPAPGVAALFAAAGLVGLRRRR